MAERHQNAGTVKVDHDGRRPKSRERREELSAGRLFVGRSTKAIQVCNRMRGSLHFAGQPLI